MRALMPLDDFDAFLRAVTLVRARVETPEKWPFTIPALKNLETLPLHSKVTYFVGENGSGKSTLVEAMAVLAGFNPEGGTTNFSFATRPSETPLDKALRLTRGVRRPKSGYFLRAESYFNVATEIERLDSEPGGPPVIDSYGGKSLHEQSHGESFMALVNNRFGPEGLYILDEPEAALSPQRQLALLQAMHRLVREDSQFVVATHSPILLAYPDACIYLLTPDGIEPVKYEETEHYALTRDFLVNRDRYLARLLSDEATEPRKPRRRR